MKGLLHSETFRKNLSRWIFLYVAVICLLTSVITYSRFISSFGNDESDTRTSRFTIEVTNIPTDNSCVPTESDNPLDLGNVSSICTSSANRPSGEVESYFMVDTSQLEVNADIYVRISSSSNIDVQRVEKVITSLEGVKYEEVELAKNESGEGKIFTISVDDIGNVDRETTSYYRVITKRKLTSDTTWNIDENEIHHIYIGYSAFQKK